MHWDKPIQQATFLRRYKRFLADVQLADGTLRTVHCPNSGSMKGCQFPNHPCLISDSQNPKRKLRYTLEAIAGPHGGYIGVNTQRPNALIAEAITSGLLKLKGGSPTELKREVPYGKERSRIDLLVQHAEGPQTWVEVKGVSLAEDGAWGLFPDAVTTRGQKHLRELMDQVGRGDRAALVFAVMRDDVTRISAHAGIDPNYAQLFDEALTCGVEMHAVRMQISSEGIEPSALLPVHPTETVTRSTP